MSAEYNANHATMEEVQVKPDLEESKEISDPTPAGISAPVATEDAVPETTQSVPLTAPENEAEVVPEATIDEATSTSVPNPTATAAAAATAGPVDVAAYDATKAALDANAAALQHHQAVVAAAAAHHAAAMQMLTGNPVVGMDAGDPMSMIATSPSTGKKMVNHYYIDFSLVTPSDVDGDAPLRGEPIGTVLTQGIAAQMSGSAGPPAPNESAMVTLPLMKKGREIRTFPMKLMELLCRQDIQHIISWLPHGRSFLVHNPDKLCAEVLPKYLKPIKYTSFTRQLQLWGFKRITKAPDHGAYYHQLFLRGKAHLVKRMFVTKVKGSGKKLVSNPSQEPDFYSLSRLRPLPDTSPQAGPYPNTHSAIPSAAAVQRGMANAYMQQAMYMPHAGFPYHGMTNPMMIPGMGSIDPALAQAQLAQMMLAQQALATAQASVAAPLSQQVVNQSTETTTKTEEEEEVNGEATIDAVDVDMKNNTEELEVDAVQEEAPSTEAFLEVSGQTGSV